jgi:hypothetical protein
MPHLISRIVAAAGVTLALTACGGGSTAAPPAAEPALRPIPRIRAYTQVTLPIEAYLPSVDQQLTLQRIADTAVNRCLREKGYDRGVVEPPTLPAYLHESARDQVVRSDLWGFYDTDNYRTYGYRRPPDVPGSIEIRNPPAPDNAVAECRKAGQAALGSLAGDPLTLPDGGPPVPRGDSRYRAAVQAWSACMAAQGFPSPDPITVQGSVQAPLTRPPTARDISTAVSDITCKNKTNLVGIAVAVQSAYQNMYIDKHVTQLTAHKEAMEKVIRAGSHN